MPKPRKTAGPWIAVSPWQTKQDKGAVSEAAPGDEAADYSEVELPLVVGGGGGSGGAPATPAMAVDPPEAGAAAAAAGPSGGSRQNKRGALAVAEAPPLAAAAAAGGWATKKRKSGAGSDDGCAGVGPPPSGAPPAAGGSTQDAAGGPGERGGQGGGQAVVLEGTAHLALMPNGSITGHLVCPPSIFGHGGRGGCTRRCYGLMGEVVVAGRECTRDAEWGVLRLTLLNFAASGGGGGEVSFLAERTEGDAMRLRAPVPWQGIEMEELPQLDASCSCRTDSGLLLAFACQQLLTGAAGEAALRRLQPSLAGRGAVLNVGDMRVALPLEAAAALLLPPPPLPQQPLGVLQGRRLAQHQQQERQQQEQQQQGRRQQQQEQSPSAGQQQRMYTGSGSGGGRVVQDSGEDW